MVSILGTELEETAVKVVEVTAEVTAVAEAVTAEVAATAEVIAEFTAEVAVVTEFTAEVFTAAAAAAAAVEFITEVAAVEVNKGSCLGDSRDNICLKVVFPSDPNADQACAAASKSAVVLCPCFTKNLILV